MIYSSACAYAIRALTRLTMIGSDGYVLLDELCKGTDLPRQFVAKTFQDLVRHGILASARGRGGGFALARPASEITLLDIVEIIDGVQSLDQCVVGMAKCDDRQPCPQHDQWKGIRNQIRSFLTETFLERMSSTLERKLQLLSTGEGKATRKPASKPKPRPKQR